MNLKSFLSEGNDRLANRLGMLAASFVIMLMTAHLLCGYILDFSGDNSYRYEAIATTIQLTLGLAIPACLTATYSDKHPAAFLSLSQPLQWKNLTGIIIVFVLGWYSFNHIISINESFIPSGNDSTTPNILLDNYSITGLLVNILIIGLLTGLCEELIFQGCLQKIIYENLHRTWLSIFITSAVFALMHFNLSGFLPLFIQGVFYGYLLYSTGTIWSAIAAHSLNNSIVVVKTWLNHTFPDSIAVSVLDNENTLLALGSLILLIVFFGTFRKYFFSR